MDRSGLAVYVNHKNQIGDGIHLADAAQQVFQTVHLALKNKGFFLRDAGKLTTVAHPF